MLVGRFGWVGSRLFSVFAFCSLVIASCAGPGVESDVSTSTTVTLVGSSTTSLTTASSTTTSTTAPLPLLPVIELVAEYGGGGFDYAAGVAALGNGDAWVAADYRSADSDGGDVGVLRYSSTGDLVWARLWGGELEDVPLRNSIAVAADGTSYVGASSYNPEGSGRDMLLFSLNPDGTLNWQLAALGVEGEQRPHAVLVADDGDVYVAGHDSIGPEIEGHEHRLPVIRLSPDGEVRWQRALERAYAIDATLDGRGGLIVAGTTDVGPDAIVAKFNTDDGSLMWVRVWGDDSSPERANDVVTDRDGNVYVSGPVTGIGNGGDSTFILKLDPDGNLLWERIWTIPGNNIWAHGAVFHPSGSLVLSGYIASVPSGTTNYRHSGFLIAVSPEGDMIWQAGIGSRGQESIEALATGDALFAAGQGAGQPLFVAPLSGELNVVTLGLTDPGLSMTTWDLKLVDPGYTLRHADGQEGGQTEPDTLLIRLAIP